MATNIPPHNLGELVDALSVLIRNPEATVRLPLSILVFFSDDLKIVPFFVNSLSCQFFLFSSAILEWLKVCDFMASLWPENHMALIE